MATRYIIGDVACNNSQYYINGDHCIISFFSQELFTDQLMIKCLIVNDD